MKPLARLVVLATTMTLTVGMAGGQSGYNKAAFEKAMEGMIRDLRIVLGALVAEDWEKAASSAASIERQARSVRALTPKANVDRIGEFNANADSLAARAGRLAEAAKAKDPGQAARLLGRTINTCMDCHGTFRK